MNNAAKSHPREQSIKELFIGKCWSYLHDNFHKFDQRNKIKIALELCKKDVPQEIKGDITHNVIMPEIQIDNRPHRFNIGDIDPSQNPRFTTEAASDN